MMGHGYRNMYYQTGLPGWMRRGYSSGWRGLPPGVQYLRQTGQLEDAQRYFRQNLGVRQQNGTAEEDTEIDRLRQEVEILKKQVGEFAVK